MQLAAGFRHSYTSTGHKGPSHKIAEKACAHMARLLLEGTLASCSCSLCAHSGLPKYLELALPHLALSARRLHVGPYNVGTRHCPNQQPSLIDRSRTACARTMAGRFVKHLSKGGLTQGATQSQPYFHAKPSPSRRNFKAAFLARPMPTFTRAQTTLPNNPLPKAWLVFKILCCWQWTSCGNAWRAACSSCTSWSKHAHAKMKSIASFLRRSSSKSFPAEAVTRQVATSRNAPAIVDTIVLKPISSSTMATKSATTW